MQIVPTDLPDLILIKPAVHGDARGFFYEMYQAGRYDEAGIKGPFVQDNLSRSTKGTIRGLHFQEPHPQGKLVTVLSGAVYDVAVDVRKGSPTFGKWAGIELSAENHLQLWVPKGFAHGFCVLSETADFFYKCTDPYRPDSEQTIRFDDPDLGIAWPESAPILSAKDRGAPRLKDALNLPTYR